VYSLYYEFLVPTSGKLLKMNEYSKVDLNYKYSLQWVDHVGI